MPVGGAPVDEVRTLVELSRWSTGVARAEVADRVGALTLLDLPAGQVRVDEHVGVGRRERRAGADDEDEAIHLTRPASKRVQTLGREELLESPGAHEAEHRVVAEVRNEPAFEFIGRRQRLLGVNDESGCEPGRERVTHLPYEHAGVALDCDDAALRDARACGDDGENVRPTFGAVAVVGGHALHRETVVRGQSSAHARSTSSGRGRKSNKPGLSCQAR